MTNSVSPLFSSLYSFNLDEWIMGLGEKAIVAWLRFHSWRDGQVSSKEPFILPISLNKVIQRLKIGKATFYKKVLQPLLDYGLIRLQPAPDSSQELHLQVHAFPDQTDDHTAESSPSTFHSGDLPSSPSPSTMIEQVNIIESETISLADIHPTSPILEETPLEQENKETDPPAPCEENIHDLTPAIDTLPIRLQQAIIEDPRLIERRNGIIQSYHDCREHPSYNDHDFIQKMQSCITYPHDKPRFGAYLRKALLNEWNNPSSTLAKKSSTVLEPPRPKDVPEWVLQQQERQRMNIPRKEEGLDPDQQAEIDELLKKLGEIK